MDLIIVESPTKAKTLGRFLGKDYAVEATMGHVKDLPKNKLGVDVDKNYAPDYILVEDRAKELNKIKGLAKKAKIILDMAASTFFKNGQYYFEGESFNQQDLSNFYTKLCQKYPIVAIEDPFAEDDWVGFQGITQSLGQNIHIIGDDVLVTNAQRIEEAQKKGACNALILKPNQAGTVSETIKAAKLALAHNWEVFVKHRSGETCDSFISDLAVGLGTGWLMAGAPNRGERIAKYNRLLMIEQECQCPN